jgi:hypothetical protein
MAAKVIELNAPAYLVVALEDVTKMLEAGDVSAARALLEEARDIAGKQLHWFQKMQAYQLQIPEGLGWTDHIHPRKS